MHIIVRVLCMQQCVKDKGLVPAHVPSCENPANLGTNVWQKTEWSISCVCAKFTIWILQSLWASMRMTKFKNKTIAKLVFDFCRNKDTAPQNSLRSFLLALSPAEMVIASSPVPADDVSAFASLASPTWSFMDVKISAIALLLTLLCGAAVCFYLRCALGKASGESFCPENG